MSRLKWLLLGAALVTITILCFPKIVTGDYIKVTITKLWQVNGQTYAVVSIASSDGIQIVEAFYDGDHYLGGGSSGSNGKLFGWPSHGTAVLTFNLNPGGKFHADSLAQSAWPARLLVHAGESHRLRLGERLYFYDFKTPDAIRHIGYIEGDRMDELALSR